MPPDVTLCSCPLTTLLWCTCCTSPPVFVCDFGMCARLLHAHVFLSKSVTGPRIVTLPYTAATPPTTWVYNRHSINASFVGSALLPFQLLGWGSMVGAGLCQKLSQSLTHIQKGNETQFLRWDEKNLIKNKQYLPCGIFHDLCFF